MLRWNELPQEMVPVSTVHDVTKSSLCHEGFVDEHVSDHFNLSSFI